MRELANFLLGFCWLPLFLCVGSPAFIWLSVKFCESGPRQPSSIRHVRKYPGKHRRWVFEYAQYRDGVEYWRHDSERYIDGWKRGYTGRNWPYWNDSGSLPKDYGWKSYDDWRAGKPAEKLGPEYDPID